MDFYAILDQVTTLLRQRQRVTYRALQRQFGFDDAYLEDLKAELIDAQRLAVDEEGKVLVWTGDTGLTAPTSSPSATTQERAPLTYTPSYLAEKILTSRSALEGERKLVTVLFADLKGSMELLADRDPEEARQLLDPVLERMMAAVHRYEGTVNQVMGDGIMALFGAPIAHEDHAIRACYAALAMQDAIRRYSEEVRRAHGCEVQIRVGLNAGEVVVRAIGNDLHMDYSAIGQTVHLAARMEQLATPGSIRLTAATLRLVEGLVVVRALGPVPVRGLTDPVEVFELVGTSAIRQRLPATVGRGLTRFVGRQTELAVLQQALEQASTGHGQVAAVVGEPGVGKTRLFYEFVHWRDCVGAGRSPFPATASAEGAQFNVPPSHRTQGWLALETTSMSYGKATTYLPVIDLLNVYFQVEEGDDPRRIREKVTGKLLTLDEALRPTLPAFLSLLEVAVEDAAWEQLNALQRRQHILDAVKSLLLRESQVQPLILVFENLHWIDSETQALLDRLVESLPTARLLLLVNYRPEYQHSWGSKTYYIQLRLDPLLPENAMELLRDLLGEDASLGGLKQRLIEWTEGNPFFLEEIVQTLVETHALVGERGAYRLVTSLETIQVPATVQAVLAARIDRLPLEEKDLLQSAAVIGKDVPGTLLQTIAELPEAALHRGLAHLQAAEFLYETSLFPDIEYTFKHALTQQVAYRSLPHERRRVVHRRVGETLERLYPAQLEEYYAQLAYHYSRSDHQEKALEYLVKTGHKAAQRYANREALEAFQQALERVQMGEEYDRILEHCANLLLGLFRGKEAARDYERLLTSARQRGNRAQELESLLGLASVFYIISIDEPDFAAQSLELYKQAYSLARELDDRVGMVRSLVPTHHFLDYWPAYRDEALANTEEALALSRELGDEELIIDSLTALYRCQRRIFGVTAELEEQAEALLKRIEVRHDLLRLKEHYFYLMQLHQQRGNFARCIECCDAGIRLAAEIGSLPVMYPTVKAFALLYLGRYDAAWAALQREIADEAHPVGSMVKDLCTGMYFLDLMAYERASATLEQAIDQTRRLQRWLFGRRAQLLLAKSLLRAGQLEPAHLRSTIQDLTSMSANLPLGSLRDIMAEEVVAELLLSEGTLDEALRQAETAASQAEQSGFRLAAISALEVQVRILLRLNRSADAVALADEALRAAEEMHYLPMVWRLSAAQAQALTRLGNTAAAAAAYQAAAAVIRQLAETISDAALKHGFLSNSLVSSIMAAAHERTRREKE